MTDIYTNEKPLGLMSDELKAALRAHYKVGGRIEFFAGEEWCDAPSPSWNKWQAYRAVRHAQTPDVIAWDRLPDWVQSVARDKSGEVIARDDKHPKVSATFWWGNGVKAVRIDDFPGLVQIGTCDWKDSLQLRPVLK